MNKSYYNFDTFCYLLNNNNILKTHTALIVQGHLKSSIESIKSIVFNDLLELEEFKVDYYLDLKINKIKQKDYVKGYNVEKIQKWLEYFDIELNDVLNLNVDSDSYRDLVGSYYLSHPDDGSEDYRTAKIAQENFLYYFLNYYAEELIQFLESIKIKTSKKTLDNSKKTNQLTSNEIVLLLQETGFFTHPNIENASKVKQAELISFITGIHQKTIKSNIQKLEKSIKVNGSNYQKDIDKINKILDDLI